MAQINLPSITGTRASASVLADDRMIIWPNAVSNTSDLKYIRFDNLKQNIISSASTTYLSQSGVIKGTLLVGSANDVVSKLNKSGTDSRVLLESDSTATGLAWGQIVTDSITNYAVTYNKLKVLQVGSISGATPSIDFVGTGLLTHDISGSTSSVTYSGTGYAAGATVTIRVKNDATTCNLLFPSGWKFVGYKPSVILPNKTAILSVTSFSTTESGCVAAWAVET